MPYRIQTYDDDAGGWTSLPLIDGPEEAAIETARALRTPEGVIFVRVIQVESADDTNGPEIWSERRDA